MSFEIQKVNTKNVENVRVLVEKCFPLNYSVSLYNKIAIDYRETSCLFYQNDFCIGCLITRVEDYIDEDNQEKYNLHIMILIVLEPYRKQGIAKQMMGWIYRQLGTLKEKIEA